MDGDTMRTKLGSGYGCFDGTGSGWGTTDGGGDGYTTGYGYGRGDSSGGGFEDAAGGHQVTSFGVVGYVSGGGSVSGTGMGVGYGTYELQDGTGGELKRR